MVRRFPLVALAAIVLLSAVTGLAFAQEGAGARAAESPSERFRSRYRYIDMAGFVGQMDADRRLLVEIRKDVPEAKEEAQLYLDRLRELAAQADPVRLVPLVNRVLSQAPIYFEWLAKEFRSQEERVTEYYVGGARGFHFALENFKSAVMLTIINRLDVASRLIQELDPAAFQ